MRSLFRWLVRIGVVFAVALVSALIAVWALLHRSLPDVDGEIRLAGLSAPVTIARDALGVPTIVAENREDGARAMGFLHGQERFFQMDLLRRAAAGELSALFGPIAVSADRRLRVHRFRFAARRAMEELLPEELRLLAAYADGVNAGRGRLGSRPFEYWILQAEPEPWLPEDSMLIAYAMWLDLQKSNGEPDLSRAIVRDMFSSPAAAFLLSAADPFQAAIDGSVIDPPPLPDSPGEAPTAFGPVGLKRTESDRFFAALFPAPEPGYALGSNSWAVAGSRSASGASIVANDMHLGLRMPNIWYRAGLRIGDRRMDGVTLPGSPLFVVGSNGHVAWGFTNSEIDTSDIAAVEIDPDDPSRYLTPDGSEPFEEFLDLIEIKGATTESALSRWTRWGPLVGTDHRGRPIALEWSAHKRGASNLNLLYLETARSVGEAMRVAQESGLPNQNFIVGDSSGSIGWTIAGPVPRRSRSGSDSLEAALGGAGWEGWLSPDEVPTVVDPPSGTLWTANARVVGGKDLALLGDGGYVLSSRAMRIRDRLSGMRDATPEDMLDLQLDVRALHIDFWRTLMLDTLGKEQLGSRPDRARLRRLAEEWNGNADADSAAYRLLREFRRRVTERASEAVFARCRDVYPDFETRRFTLERIVRELVTAKPAAWLPEAHPGWDSLIMDSLDELIASAEAEGGLERFTWGEYNRLEMRHPLSAALPLVGYWLDMPRSPLSGDSDVVNKLRGGSGPSQRMAVAPGREIEGIMQMPGGQSGNPISPHYDAMQAQWLNGEPTPFLPGPAVSSLLLTP